MTQQTIQDRLRDDGENLSSQHEREARILTARLRHDAAAILDECRDVLRAVLQQGTHHEVETGIGMITEPTEACDMVRSLLAKLEAAQ